MNSKIKGILTCAVAVIVGVYLWGLLKNGAVSPVPAIMVGGVAGIISGVAISIVRGGSAPYLVGALTMTALWGVVALTMIQEFGTSGVNFVGITLTTFIVAAIGFAGGHGYKLGAR